MTMLLFMVRLTFGFSGELGKSSSFSSTTTTTDDDGGAAAAVVVNEGSLHGMRVAHSLAQKPGEMAAFYNPKRRVGRDCNVLSVAQWMIVHNKQQKKKKKKKNDVPLRVLDAHAASGMTGLRVAVESPILAQTYLDYLVSDGDNSNTSSSTTAESTLAQQSEVTTLMNMNVILNDVSPEAAQVATHNANIVATTLMDASAASPPVSISVSNRNSQSLWHESSFDVSLVDPFGCTTVCLDAALAQAPQGGLLQICATDVTALYGGRPAMATRHYGYGAQCFSTSRTRRPPCFKERGVRLLLAAIAQAAGRQDRGIRPLYSLCTAHYVVVAIQVVRRGQEFGPDASIQQVQRISICQTCGAPGTDGTSTTCSSSESSSSISDDTGRETVATFGQMLPDCTCDALGAGTSAGPEGPFWLGPLHDSDHLRGMMDLATISEQAQSSWITPETKKLIQTMYQESLVQQPITTTSPTTTNSTIAQRRGLFHRRPSLAAPGRMPPLDALIKELKRRGFQACRTQFDAKALKCNATSSEFDNVVRDMLLL